MSIEQFAELQGLEPALQLLDVRNPDETGQGTLPRAREIPLAMLTALLDGLDRSAPVLVYCASGYRSQIAASVLQRAASRTCRTCSAVTGPGRARDCGLRTRRRRL